MFYCRFKTLLTQYCACSSWLWGSVLVNLLIGILFVSFSAAAARIEHRGRVDWFGADVHRARYTADGDAATSRIRNSARGKGSVTPTQNGAAKWKAGTFYYRPQTKFAKVMFLHLSVSHSVHRRSRGSTWAGPPPGQVHPPPQCMLGILSTSGRYASHWNAFFLFWCLRPLVKFHLNVCNHSMWVCSWYGWGPISWH